VVIIHIYLVCKVGKGMVMQITRELYITYIFLVKMIKTNIWNLLHYPIGTHN